MMRRAGGAAQRAEDQRPAAGFEVFFREQFATTVRIANAVVRDAHRAEDVAQEAFIATQRRFPDPQRASGAAGWLHAAAAHLALNEVRGQKRHARRTHYDIGPNRGDGPEDVAVANDEGARVRRALRRLPRHSATVLVLRYSGLAYGEIAEAMDVRVNHVGTMLRRAERALRKEIERETPE